MSKKYYEVTFGNEFANTGKCTSDFSICIVGIRRPTIAEANSFCKSDLKRYGYKCVTSVKEISSYEAHEFFDMDDEEQFPVFGK